MAGTDAPDDETSYSGERRVVDRSETPVTPGQIAEDLRDLGVTGETVIVHSSLSAIGWVPGGAQGAVEGLREGVTPDGTLVMPTHSTQLSDPAHWEAPPVPDDWVEVIRETMPAYHPEATPTRGMGAIPECFRDYPDVHRSRHPHLSFAAWGRDAEAVVADHSYDDAMGDGSPLARVYDRDGTVLLLGVGHDRNTSLHLAEYRADLDHDREVGWAVVEENGERTVIHPWDIPDDDSDFPEIGAAFETDHPEAVTVGQVGAATARLLDQRSLVDYAAAWMTENRE